MSEKGIERGRDTVETYVARHEYTPGRFPGFSNVATEDLESFCADLVADVMHFAASKGFSTTLMLDRAMLHYDEETLVLTEGSDG